MQLACIGVYDDDILDGELSGFIVQNNVHSCGKWMSPHLLYAQSHSDNGHVHATAPCSAHVLAPARPTMSYIPLVVSTDAMGI